MATHGLRYLPLFFCLIGILAGCHSGPSVPYDTLATSSDKNSYDDTDGDGWALNRLLGHESSSAERPAKEKSNTAPMFDPAVRQTSAAQPIPSFDNPVRTKPPTVELADQSRDDPRKGDEKPLVEDEEEESLFGWLDFSPEDAYNDMKNALGYGPDKKLADKYLKEGLEHYHNKRYKEAAAKFKLAAGRWPDSTLEEDALYLQGECLFFADDYPDADDAFSSLLKKYDNSRHLDKVMLREFAIARYWDQYHQRNPEWSLTPNLTDSTRPRIDTHGYARKIYERIVMNDPTGPLADDALMALGNGYFLESRYVEAAEQYDRLRRDHPNSKHIIDAHLMLVKSKQLAYQGALYDETPLKEAGEIADQTVRQFGTRLGAEREKLIKIQAEVEREMAYRDWVMADFYEGKKQFGAARFYYEQLIKDYPATTLAEKARHRLDEIKEFPDKPKDRFRFLTKLFPDDE